MPDPLVTIVTPSYNQGHFIRATIESVLSQDYPAIEYIIMDGGSTDETASIVKDYSSRVTFISEKDRGQSHAINKGFRMASGPIVSWLNSDDLYLPGAVRTAVAAWRQDASAGAVYGEGYLIDRAGNTTCRFPCTEPFNLWKLFHLSDYVLQQTVYFRKDVLDTVGYLDEDFHYVMDWDILIRIGMRHSLLYVPEYMGCLREYPEAKSSAGGMRRAAEIREMLQRHTRRMVPLGYVVYGLDTYQKLACDAIERYCGAVKPVSRTLQSAVRFAAGTIIGRTIHQSQGLYSDGWASRVLRYMLPAGDSPQFIIEGYLPDWPEWAAPRGQTIRIQVNGRSIGLFDVPVGEFQMLVPLPPDVRGSVLDLAITSSKWHIPEREGSNVHRRKLAFKLHRIRWAEPSSTAEDSSRAAHVGI